MDPTVLFGEAAKLGFVVLLLLFAVVYLVRRDDRIQSEDRLRTAGMIEGNRKECLEREQDMNQRLRAVEDRSHGETAELLRTCAHTLKTNADTFAKLIEHDSGAHRALTNHKDT